MNAVAQRAMFHVRRCESRDHRGACDALGDKVDLEPLGELAFRGKAAVAPVFAVKAQAQR